MDGTAPTGCMLWGVLRGAGNWKVGGKSPAARDEAHEALAARCGTGDTIEGPEREGGERVCGEFLGVFGLERPGGGPEEEAMPGAVALQATESVGVFMRGRDRKGKWGGRGEHTK